MVYDMTRKGFIDGRSLRLPTVTVRPGKPNRAASSFASGIIREPLSGVEAICPVTSTAAMWVTSPRSVIANLITGHEVPATEFARAGFAHTRAVNVPGLRVGVGQMIDALKRVAGEAVAVRVKWQLDPVIDRIVATWRELRAGAGSRARHARRSGLRRDHPAIYRRRETDRE
jgi:hypothetical protein